MFVSSWEIIYIFGRRNLSNRYAYFIYSAPFNRKLSQTQNAAGQSHSQRSSPNEPNISRKEFSFAQNHCCSALWLRCAALLDHKGMWPPNYIYIYVVHSQAALRVRMDEELWNTHPPPPPLRHIFPAEAKFFGGQFTKCAALFGPRVALTHQGLCKTLTNLWAQPITSRWFIEYSQENKIHPQRVGRHSELPHMFTNIS